MERKLAFKIFFLFLFGLLFIVESVIFLIFDVQGGTLNILKGFLYVAGVCIGVFLLVHMVRMVVIMPKEVVKPPADSLLAQQLEIEKKRKIEQAKVNKARWVGWVSVFGGPLLTAACIYLFWAYGPQHDPPGMTAAHQVMDMVIDVVCGSVAFIGLVIAVVGIRKLTRLTELPPDIYK